LIAVGFLTISLLITCRRCDTSTDHMGIEGMKLPMVFCFGNAGDDLLDEEKRE